MCQVGLVTAGTYNISRAQQWQLPIGWLPERQRQSDRAQIGCKICKIKLQLQPFMQCRHTHVCNSTVICMCVKQVHEHRQKAGAGNGKATQDRRVGKGVSHNQPLYMPSASTSESHPSPAGAHLPLKNVVSFERCPR